MKYGKYVSGGYLIGISTNGGQPIDEEEYAKIRSLLQNAPAAPDGYGYRLTESLQWELYELPPADPDPELSAEEALGIILGGDTHETV